jgi:hypothetical protein
VVMLLASIHRYNTHRHHGVTAQTLPGVGSVISN